MSGPKTSNSDFITPKSPLPAGSLPTATMGAGEDFNDLPKKIIRSDEENESNSYTEIPVLNRENIGKEEATPGDPPPPVLYTVRYLNTEREVIYTRTDKKPLQVRSTHSHNTAAIEIITDVLTSIPRKSGDGEKEEPQTTATIRTQMKIISPAIITATNTLVMKDERRRLIKALAENYQNKTESSAQPAHNPWAADFVAGKEEGKIFLLHGMPGVGKTYTAECIAAYTKRPLLSLTISDIGTVPLHTETRLNKYFTRAKRWNAIILIEEADVYMERREVQDLTRNSLVSGFLRATENCQSILFLTTNRVGSFDDAFVSRIHIALYYPKFTNDDRRQIWKDFFGKLARDRKNTIHIPPETSFYVTEPEVTSLEWNGREIRNAFQTTVALADFDGADEDGKFVLRKTHIQQIVRMSQEFKDYLKELHRGDEAKRAERQRIRYDEFVSDVRSQK